MATLRKDRFKAGLVLTTLALCAFFLAQGATALVAAKVLQGEPTVERGRPRGRPAASFEWGRRDPGMILRRNIFNSSLGDLTQVPLVESDTVDGELALEEGQVLSRCSGTMRLVGTAVVPGDFDRSLAVIVGSDRKTGLHQGAADVEGSRIRAIHSDSVILQPSSGSLCRLAMFEVGDKPTKAKPLPKPKTRQTKRRGPQADRSAGLTAEEMAEGIEKVSETNYNVRRSLLNKVLDNAGRLIGIAAVAPKIEDGQSVGMEIRGVVPNTLLGKLGIKNNDILESVNGQPITSPDTALELYTTLRTADKFNISIRRGGQSIVINYTLN